MASTSFFIFALAASAAARPSNSNTSSVFTKPIGEFEDMIDQNSPYILDDMRFADWQLDSERGVLTSNITFKWPNGTVPYFIDLPLDLQFGTLIRSAMNHIRIKTGECVKFRRLLLPPLLRTNYVRISNGTGCSSNVGMVGGRQNLTLGPGCYFKGTIVHELCHALGFFHEQNRNDRDTFITIFTENIQPAALNQFFKLAVDQQSNVTTYDLFSIMHYGSHAFSKNNLTTMAVNPPNQDVILTNPDKKDGLTQKDIDTILSRYEC